MFICQKITIITYKLFNFVSTFGMLKVIESDHNKICHYDASFETGAFVQTIIKTKN